MEQFYTIAEIKDLLKVSDATIRRYIRAGKLESRRIGNQHRITEASVNKFLDGQDKLKENTST